MSKRTEYPPLNDAVKSLERVMSVFARECAAGSTWARLHTLSDRILERRSVVEIVLKRSYPASERPSKLGKLTTPELLDAAKSRLTALNGKGSKSGA